MLAGSAAAGWGVATTPERAAFRHSAAVAAPCGVALALLGGVLWFVPRFFG